MVTHMIILFHLLLMLPTSFANDFYITGAASFHCPFLHLRCLTLNQYANESMPLGFSTNITLTFEPGTHSLSTTLRVANLRSLKIYTASVSNPTNVTVAKIFCTSSKNFIFENISLVEVRGITFIGCGEYKVRMIDHLKVVRCNFTGSDKSGRALYLEVVTRAVISNSLFNSHTFPISTDKIYKTAGAILAINSTLTINYTTFSHNNAGLDHGSCLSVFNSTVIVYSSEFVNNSARRSGGTIYAQLSNVMIFDSQVKDNCLYKLRGTKKTLCSGAIYGNNSCVMIRNTSFISNYANGTAFSSNSSKRNTDSCTVRQCGGAILVTANSSLNVTNSLFRGNRAYYRGGAIYSDESRVYINHCNFTHNRADYGGAVFVNASHGSNVTKCKPNQRGFETVLNNSNFSENTAKYRGGAVHGIKYIKLFHNSFYHNKVNSKTGGAVTISYTINVTVLSNCFRNNEAKEYGGAIYASSYNGFTINITNCTFDENTAKLSGGAVFVKIIPEKKKENNLKLQLDIGQSSFTSNEARHIGGALYVEAGNFTLLDTNFTRNKAVESGGAIYMEKSLVHIKTGRLSFVTNSASHYGGAIAAISSELYNTNGILDIVNNSGSAGVVYCLNGKMLFGGCTTIGNNRGSVFAFNSKLMFTGSSLFEQNHAPRQTLSSNRSTSVIIREGGAITGIQSDINFTGNSTFSCNSAIYGGAIKLTELSKLFFNSESHTLMMNNTANKSGGGIFAYQSEVNFQGIVNLTNNIAQRQGGGIDATVSAVKLISGSLRFTQNSATHGGGLSLSLNSKLYVIKMRAECQQTITNVCYKTKRLRNLWLKLEFKNNTANYGGAVFVNDSKTASTCKSRYYETGLKVRECFLQVLAFYSSQGKKLTKLHINNINFLENKAKIAGSNIYGGLLDRCILSPLDEIHSVNEKEEPIYAVSHLLKITNIDNLHTIASNPVRLWFCQDNQRNSSYKPAVIKVKKGEQFILDVVAVDQVNNTVNATIHSFLSSQSSRLKEGQAYQTAGNNCSKLQFNVFSKENTENISLYAIGPCNGTGISKQTIEIEFEKCTCPIGFQLASADNDCDCECHSSLAPLIVQCNISTQTLEKKGEFWITSTAEGAFINYSNCPFDFCKPSDEITYINFNVLNGADAQCAFNRSGVLCGACEEGLSLILGSSRCLQCSNNKIGLIIPFAIAGIALVVFLLVCNLTVAVGTLNGLIFYANIVIANRSLFFPFHKPNIMTVFIAWLNLDLGVETCFYNGMDAYAKIWLQLVFPSYLILLVVTVIIVSEKSSRFAKILAGRNPVATLVTVILLSYTKLLRTIIYALAVANIHYPDSVHTVWLFDGNVDYWKGKHIPLFIAAVIIIIIGLVFTFILFSWQWILQLSDKVRALKWITNPKLNSVMDAYHAPFNPKHRYWSGLLLFARVLLYVLSAGNIYGDPRASLIIINITMTCLIVFKLWFGNRMYKKWILNILEDVFIINIIIFAVATKYIKNNNLNQAQTSLAYTSTSVAIVIFCGILVYHTFAFVIDIKFIKKLCYNFELCQKKFKIFTQDKEEYDTQLEQLIGKPSSADYRLAEISFSEQPVTTSVVTLDNVGSDYN